MSMWDQRYGEEGYAYGDAPNEFLRKVAAQIPDGSVLCLAEGEGRNGIYLASLGYAVLAVDQSPVGLDKAKYLAAERGVRIDTQVADLSQFAFEKERFEGIVSIWAHVPPDVRRRVHEGCVASLRPGGVMVLEAYSPAQVGRGTGGPPDPAFCMTAEGLREELRGLDFEILQETERNVVEGRYHTGEAAVVQMVARKPI